MCNRFRSVVGTEWKPGDKLPLELASAEKAEGVWAGFSTSEKLAWWLRQPGNELAQTFEEVAEVAERADDTREIIWGPAPKEARLLFVLQPSPAGKNYRLARMVTTAATDSERKYYRHGRFPLFGKLSDGQIEEIASVPAPEPPPKAQGELFTL